MYKRPVTYRFVIFSAICALLVFHSKAFCQEPSVPKGVSYIIQDIHADLTSNSATITVTGNTAPAYTAHEQVEPLRLVMDIAGASFGSKIDANKLIPDNQLVKLSATVLNNQSPAITQFIFQIKENYQYKVERDNNNLIVKIFPAEKGAAPDTSAAAGGAEKAPSADMKKDAAGSKSSKATASDATLDELIGSSVAALEKKQKKATAAGQALDRASGIEDPFTNAGYKKQRISVDFYKIDIHNVFRLFRQVSDVNIVVDEAVKGSITIALNDVPWDFALDIICNLADLKKEERLNTIVIYPKSKAVEWPVSPIDNLSIKADKDVIQQEALIVQQSTTQSKEITQAKEIIVKAQAKEKSEDYQDAVSLYEQAYTLWPTNERISNKLAVLYLVNLRMNAKALFYARASLKTKHNDDNAALYAAIASANMERLPEATEYFNQSVSGSPPLKEALMSYAAFNENFGRPEAALKLLDKYNANYGETLETMLAKARMHDKMGNSAKAMAQYNAILSSGYQIPPDLKQYIDGRLRAGNY
ncbi:MAG: AMIN domain-containing protein [Desulfocapsaceae bacterium]|nr:AMIN domain-containing protein [Desulfocapsaceae bacterium]